MEDHPKDHFQIKSQLQKVLRLAEYMFGDTEKNLPLGLIPDLWQPTIIHHIAGHHDHFRQEIKLLSEHPYLISVVNIWNSLAQTTFPLISIKLGQIKG